MKLLLKNASVFLEGTFERADVAIEDGRIFGIFKSSVDVADVGEAIDLKGKFLFPGFTDVHVHLREPGFFYKETVAAASRAAAASGYTALCAMPNLNPVPDCEEHLAEEQAIIDRDAVIAVYPYASITVGERGEELVDFAALNGKAIAFSDDGTGVRDEGLMRAAMEKAASLGVLIAAHCEDERFSGGYVHDGKYAAEHGHKGISSASEYVQVARDVALAEATGAKYHVCHVSTKESAEIIREAKRRGVDVTAETAPHYLTLCDEDLREDGRFKMNPPLRSREDRDALIEALADGVIDFVATDHAPHSAEEKSRGLEKSLFGISGLETAFPILYTRLVRTGKLTLARLVEAMSTVPARRFGLRSGIERGAPADLTAFDLGREYVIDGARFLSKGKSTPFDGEKVYGKCALTIYNGRIVWNTTEN